jgi:hypothetical protein
MKSDWRFFCLRAAFPFFLACCALAVAASALACSGCGCRGGPGYRGPDGRCVGWADLAKKCGSPPTKYCTGEGPNVSRFGAVEAPPQGPAIPRPRAISPAHSSETKCAGTFDELVIDAGKIAPSDIVKARQMRLACLTLLQIVQSPEPSLKQTYCPEEAAQLIEACKIADSVIEDYEARRTARPN